MLFFFLDAQHNTVQSDCTMAISEPEIILTLTPVPYPDASPSSEPSLEPTSPVQNNTWVSTFSVPWEKTHESLRRCLAQRKRPEAPERRHMMRVIAEAIRQVCLNPCSSSVPIWPRALWINTPILLRTEQKRENDWGMDIAL